MITDITSRGPLVGKSRGLMDTLFDKISLAVIQSTSLDTTYIMKSVDSSLSVYSDDNDSDEYKPDLSDVSQQTSFTKKKLSLTLQWKLF